MPVLSLFLASHSSNTIIKFADDTTVEGLITNNDETAYREDVGTLTAWCQVNNFSLNVSKIKELIVDFRRNQARHPHILMNWAAADIKFLVVHISEELKWSNHTDPPPPAAPPLDIPSGTFYPPPPNRHLPCPHPPMNICYCYSQYVYIIILPFF
ncbi:unnamed protein product [Coregonus sp. 'balchen']|nr:unnamed protein product [Coregonus sp. 'balchen']